jgi:hypothetical protein
MIAWLLSAVSTAIPTYSFKIYFEQDVKFCKHAIDSSDPILRPMELLSTVSESFGCRLFVAFI